MLMRFLEGKHLLDRYGIPLAPSFASNDLGEILSAGQRMQRPQVLKVMASEMGLVAMNLASDREIMLAYAKLAESVKRQGIKVDTYLLQEQEKGVEFMIGGKKDSVFGQTVLFGLGGIYVELYRDFSLRICPISRADAERMIGETKAKAFLGEGGFRGKRANRDKVIELLMNTAKMLEENPQITELDFNPVIADENKAAVVDARIITEK